MGNLTPAVQAQCEQAVEGAQAPYEERTLRQAIQERRDHLQRQWRELDDLERNLPGYFLEMKRKEFQGIYNIM